MFRNLLKTPELFISYRHQKGVVHHPVIPIVKNRDTPFEVEGEKFIIAAGRFLGKGVFLRDKDGKSFELKQNQSLKIEGENGEICFRIIYDWAKPDEQFFWKFFWQSLVFHIIVVGAFAIPYAMIPPKVENPVNKEPTAERVKQLLAKIKDKKPLKIKEVKKPPPPEVVPEKIVVEKKKKKKKGVWPTKRKLQKKIAARKPAARAPKKGGGSRTGKKPVSSKSINDSLSFLSSTSAKRMAKTAKTADSSKYASSYGKGKGGALVGKGIKSEKNILDSTGTYSGPINTKGVRGIKDAKYGDGKGIGGGGKSLNAVEGKVSKKALMGSGSGKVGGALSKSGSMKLSGKGKVSEAAVERAIKKKLSKLRYCYEKALFKNSNLAGLIKIQWVIKPNGKVPSGKIVSSELNNGKLHRCLIKEIKKIRFPKPKGGNATVQYPFQFNPTTL